jgi:cholesterol oxidase
MENWPMKLTPSDYTAATEWMTKNRGAANQVVTKFPLPKQKLKDPSNPASGPDPNQQGYSDPQVILKNNPNLYLGRSRFLKDAADAVALGPEWKKIDGWAPLDLQVFEFTGDDITPGDLKKFVYCERQGRCFMGCLPGARHTLNKTLINTVLDVPNAPVTLRALTEVDRIEQTAGGYRVFYDQLHLQDNGRESKTATAPVVVLAAGVLGTTELLLRSQSDTFQFSSQLGGRFSSNGDSAGFITGLIGLGYNIYTTRGPINTSHVMYQVALQNGKTSYINVEDAGIPPLLASSVRRALEVLGNAAERDPFFGQLQALWNLAEPDPSFFGLDPDARVPDRSQTEAEMLMSTFFFNLMGRDEARGRFTLNGGNLALDFEGGPLKNDAVFQKIDDVMKAMAFAMSGQYVRFPFWSRGAIPRLLGNDEVQERKVVTVHPLGGCPIGAAANSGTVSTNGQVFKRAGDVYPGLFVADASVIPGPVAVNPTLTIVAIALKIAQNIAAA